MPTPTRRRWYQVSIRTLLAIVAVLAIWLAWGLHWVRSREETLRALKTDEFVQITYPAGMPPRPWKEMPVTLRLLRAEPVGVIYLGRDDFSQLDIDRVQALFRGECQQTPFLATHC